VIHRLAAGFGVVRAKLASFLPVPGPPGRDSNHPPVRTASQDELAPSPAVCPRRDTSDVGERHRRPERRENHRRVDFRDDARRLQWQRLHPGREPRHQRWPIRHLDPKLASGGVYEIFGRWTAGSDRASNARYDIVTAGGKSTVFADQRSKGGAWVSLGFFDVNAATTSVTIRNDAANGRVIADAERFVRVS
jgi:hypothetical protein